MSAQNVAPFSYNTEFTPSVESYSIVKYGGIKPALYTGSMTYSLPLHIYKDEDFEFPISLEYAFDGYKPAIHSGTVGYGWRLNCGGVITREIYGYPDDLSGSNNEDKFDGYYKKEMAIHDSMKRDYCKNKNIPLLEPRNSFMSAFFS